jgi:hypothetical protein
MIRQAQQWVDMGRLLETSTTDERLFWNRRLREPRGDWDWESAEARMALQKLGRSLPKDGSGLQLIQHTVPGCWWDLWREQPVPDTISMSAALPPPSAPPPAPRKRGSFTLGVLLGALAMCGAGWFYITQWPELTPSAQTEPPPDLSEGIAPEPLISNELPTPPIRDSLRQLIAALQSTTEPASTSAITASPADTTEPSAPIKPAGKPQPKELAREKERLAFAQKHPELKRLYSLTRGNTLREDNGMVQGSSTVAPLGSQLHQDLIRMLILDPPEHAEMRRAVTRLAMRSLPVADIISLFDLCLYPDSPNEFEIKQCLSMLQDLPPEGLTEDQRKRLKAMTSGL